MFRNLLCSLVLAGILFGFSGCGAPDSEGKAQKPVVTINGLKMSAEEVKRERTFVPDPLPSVLDQQTTEEPEWVARLIERELLVQEAQRLGLDREPEFMQTIERFWKEALMKQVVQRTAREISSQVQVYEPEIEAYYKQLVEESKGAHVEPLAVMRREIERTIRQHKETEAMERWVERLRAQAKVEVDQKEIERIR